MKGVMIMAQVVNVGREKRIPFEVSVDPFYSEENMTRLRKAIQDLDAGKGTAHEVDYE